jgi:hypothetical protein
MCAMSTLPRPPQTTFLAGVVIGGGVLVVLSAFSRVSTLRTLEVQEALADEIDGRYSSLGLDVGDLQAVVHVASMVTAGCAVAMAILAWFVLQRSRPARLGLAVLAVPLALSGFVAQPRDLVAPIVVMATVMLWFQPSRDWFDGVAPARPVPPVRTPEPDRRTEAPVAPPSYPAAPGVSGVSEARPVAGFGIPAPAVAPPAPDVRPQAVLRACVLAWVAAGVIVLGGVWRAVTTILDPEPVMDQLRDVYSGMSVDVEVTTELATVVAVVSGLLVCGWGAGLAVVAWFALRRASWARITLLVGAVLTGVWSLLAFAGGDVLMIVPLAALAVTSSSLVRPEVRRWYAARGATGS